MSRLLASQKKIRICAFRPRFFSNKLEQQRLTEDITQELEEVEKNVAPAIRYNVCRDRTSSTVQKYQFPKSPQEEAQKADNLENASLESSMFDSQPDLSSPSATRYRQFEASSTYKNLVLPLKASKLSDPFPSPVKMMPSHTVSDQEKAEQMMAERRIPRSITRKK